MFKMMRIKIRAALLTWALRIVDESNGARQQALAEEGRRECLGTRMQVEDIARMLFKDQDIRAWDYGSTVGIQLPPRYRDMGRKYEEQTAMTISEIRSRMPASVELEVWVDGKGMMWAEADGNKE